MTRDHFSELRLILGPFLSLVNWMERRDAGARKKQVCLQALGGCGLLAVRLSHPRERAELPMGAAVQPLLAWERAGPPEGSHVWGGKGRAHHLRFC